MNRQLTHEFTFISKVLTTATMTLITNLKSKARNGDDWDEFYYKHVHACIMCTGHSYE